LLIPRRQVSWRCGDDLIQPGRDGRYSECTSSVTDYTQRLRAAGSLRGIPLRRDDLRARYRPVGVHVDNVSIQTALTCPTRRLRRLRQDVRSSRKNYRREYRRCVCDSAAGPDAHDIRLRTPLNRGNSIVAHAVVIAPRLCVATIARIPAGIADIGALAEAGVIVAGTIDVVIVDVRRRIAMHVVWSGGGTVATRRSKADIPSAGSARGGAQVRRVRAVTV
jgi:hypothetical protein